VRIAVIEDERPAARRLIDLLTQVAPEATVAAQLASVAEVRRYLATQPPPELWFADIELRDGRVFDAFTGHRPMAPIIFTTAYDQFMVDAFRAQGIAYLLKPFSAAELAAALAKYEDLRRALSGAAQLERLIERLDGERHHRRHLAVEVGRKVHLVALEQVAVLRLGLAGIAAFDRDGVARPLTGNASLAELEASLPAADYFRINRTEIVRLDAIHQLDPQRDRVVLSVCGQPSALAVSVHRSAAFRKWAGLG
jgi:two-component system response regulator LytT